MELYIKKKKKNRPTEILEPYGQIPSAKPNFEEAEQAVAFKYACSTQTIPPPLKPVSADDLKHTLKVITKKFLPNSSRTLIKF